MSQDTSKIHGQVVPIDGNTYDKWMSYMSSQERMNQLNKLKSLAKQIQKTQSTIQTEIDPNTFADVGKDKDADTQNAEDQRINDYANAEDPEQPDEPLPDIVDPKTKKASKTSVFPMIFKVIPIGLNIFKKFPKVMSGLKDITIATEKIIVNTILTTADLVPSGLAYIMLTFVMGMYHLMCAIINIKNLHICCIPYFLDLIASLVILTICSFVSILDSILLQKLFGFPLFDIVRYGFDRLGSYIHYPDYITELCYKCKLTQDNILYDIASNTSKQTGIHIGKVITKDVPKRVIDPVKLGIGGITKMTSIFNI
jgi:hypothetical protein